MSITWFIIRASGLVAFGLLAASTVWGLLLSTGLFGRSVKAKGLSYVHESLAVGSLLATFTHMAFLTVDEWVPFTIAELLVPGLSAWEPLAVALGVVAMWFMLVITVSFYVRRRIGQRVWRALHYGSFGAYVAAAVHGVTAGTDTANPFVMYLYVGSLALVVGLLVLRVIGLPPDRGDRSRRTERNLDRGSSQRRPADRDIAAGSPRRTGDDVETESRRVPAARASSGDEPVGEAGAPVLDREPDPVGALRQGHSEG